MADIERIKDNNGKEKLQNLSIEEQGELYHKYLERVNYIPVTTMQGYYIVQFLNGIKFLYSYYESQKHCNGFSPIR